MKKRDELEELRGMSDPELTTALHDTRQSLFQNRVRFATRNLDSITPLHEAKRRVVRILTIVRERELVAEAAE